MKYGIVIAFVLVFLAGCDSNQPPENHRSKYSTPAADTVQESPVSPQAQGPAPVCPATFPGGKRLGKAKAPAPGGRGPERPPLLEPPSRRLPPGIVAAGQRGAPPTPALPEDSTEELSFDAKRVFLGESVKHTFRVKNSSAEVWTIQKDTDVLPNCGCASLAPQNRTLPPGAETEVQVTVRPGGALRRPGPFAHGGKIVWTTAGGLRHATALTIRGEAVGALTSNPQTLVFQPEEVKRGTVKEVVFSGNAPVDWSTWTLESTSPNFQIVEKTSPKEGTPASCKVKCLAPEGLENFHGEIRAQVQRSGSKGVPIVHAVPVRARQAVDLTISPPVVPVVFGRPSDRATVKLFFRGEQVSGDQVQVEAIDFPNCKATWKLTKKGKESMALLEVTLVRQPEASGEVEKKPAKTDPALVIHLMGRKPITVPAVVVGPSADRP